MYMFSNVLRDVLTTSVSFISVTSPTVLFGRELTKALMDERAAGICRKVLMLRAIFL